MFWTKNIDLAIPERAVESYSNITGIGTEAPITRLSNYRALWRERRKKVFDGEGVRSIDARAAAIGRGPEGDALHARVLGGFRCEGLTERFAHTVIEEVIGFGGAVRFGSAERGQSSVGVVQSTRENVRHRAGCGIGVTREVNSFGDRQAVVHHKIQAAINPEHGAVAVQDGEIRVDIAGSERLVIQESGGDEIHGRIETCGGNSGDETRVVSGEKPILIGFGADRDFAFHVDGVNNGHAVRAENVCHRIEELVSGLFDM